MIEKISTKLAQLTPQWESKVTSRSGQVSNPEAEMRKLMGEPLPKKVPLEDLPPHLRALFGMYGMLQKVKKKLEWISRRKGGKIIPAENTIACVDEDDNLYIGVGFLAKHHKDEEVIAGIMAHEWGHMMSHVKPGEDFSHLNWDEMHALRREEEGAADSFAGRAMFQMGYNIERLAQFIENFDKIERKVKSQKYYNPKVRAAILREAYIAQKEASDQLQKFFGDRTNIIDPSKSKLIGIA